MKKHNHASNWKGKKASKTYRSWSSIVQRCCNPNHAHYKSYNGLLSERWKTFINFLEDMGERPEGMSIDRVDNTKGYYKENCRWATCSQQARNRKNSLPSETVCTIVKMHLQGYRLKDISEATCLNISRVKNIVYRGDYR